MICSPPKYTNFDALIYGPVFCCSEAFEKLHSDF